MSGDAASVAAGLTKAQREAVCADNFGDHGRSIRALFRLGLVTCRHAAVLPPLELTPLGLEVRAILERTTP